MNISGSASPRTKKFARVTLAARLAFTSTYMQLVNSAAGAITRSAGASIGSRLRRATSPASAMSPSAPVLASPAASRSPVPSALRTVSASPRARWAAT